MRKDVKSPHYPRYNVYWFHCMEIHSGRHAAFRLNKLPGKRENDILIGGVFMTYMIVVASPIERETYDCLL